MKVFNIVAVLTICNIFITTNAWSNSVVKLAEPFDIFNTNQQQAKETNVDFIAFDDSDHHADYLKEEKVVPLRKYLESFIEFEITNWIETLKPIDKIVIPPMSL